MKHIARTTLLFAGLLSSVACGEEEGPEPVCAGQKQLFVGSWEVLPGDDDAALEGLRCVEVITGDLTITQSKLASLAGLASLVEIHGNLLIEGNEALTSLAGLERLEQVSGLVSLRDNVALESLSALGSLHTVGALRMWSLHKLESLAGLETLKSVKGTLDISSNDGLLDLDALTGLRQVDGFLEISDNGALTSATLPTPFVNARLGIRIYDNPSLRTLSRFGSFDGHREACESVKAYIAIHDNTALETITFEDGSVAGACIYVFDNPRLQRISANSFTRQIALELRDLPRLTEVDLPGNFVLGSLAVLRTGLATLSGLRMARVECELEIDQNPELASLGSFARSSHVAAASYVVSRNPKLPTCEAETLLKALPKDRHACLSPFGPLITTDRFTVTDDNDTSAVCK